MLHIEEKLSEREKLAKNYKDIKYYNSYIDKMIEIFKDVKFKDKAYWLPKKVYFNKKTNRLTDQGELGETFYLSKFSFLRSLRAKNMQKYRNTSQYTMSKYSLDDEFWDEFRKVAYNRLSLLVKDNVNVMVGLTLTFDNKYDIDYVLGKYLLEDYPTQYHKELMKTAEHWQNDMELLYY